MLLGGTDRNRHWREGAWIIPPLNCLMQQLVEFIIMVKSCRGGGRKTSPTLRRAELEVQAVGLLLPALPFSPCGLPAGCSDVPLPAVEKR